MVSRAPDAVTICCSFVPANCPSIACVTDVGGWIVSEYINILEVAAILLVYTAQGWNKICALPYEKVPLRRGTAFPNFKKH